MFNTAVKMSVIRSRVHGQPIRDVQLLSTCCQNMSVRARVTGYRNTLEKSMSF